MQLAAFRRALLPAVVVAATLLSGASTAGAQRIAVAYGPSCGPGTSCTTLRFLLSNPTASTLLINALSLTASGAPYLFAPTASRAP